MHCNAPAYSASSNKALCSPQLLLLKASKVTLDHRQQWRGAGIRLCLRMKLGPAHAAQTAERPASSDSCRAGMVLGTL